MEFEISDDGVLKAYHGHGGDVVIPEGVKFIDKDCRFDRSLEITSIYIPKSFIGQRFNDGLKSSFDLNHENNEVSNIYINFTPQKEPKVGFSRYWYLAPLDFNNLDSYIVHPQNPIYTSINGLLYSKCQKYLLDIPHGHSGDLTLMDSFLKFRHCIKYLGSIVVKYVGQKLSTDLLEEFGSMAIDRRICLYGPKVTSCDDARPKGKWLKYQNKIVAIIPQIHLTQQSINTLGLSPALGYCFSPMLYDEERAQECIELLLLKEHEMYYESCKGYDTTIQDCYKKEWTNNRLPKIDTSTQVGKIHYLFELILRGSADELKQFITDKEEILTRHLPKDDSVLSVGAYALSLAARYGGSDKLKCLLDMKHLCLEQFGQDLIERYYRQDEYYYWLTGYQYLFSRSRKSYLPVASGIEVRGLKPLSEEERLDCLKLLVASNLIDIDGGKSHNMMCFLAILSEDFKIAQYLLSQGANIVEFFDNHFHFIDSFGYKHMIEKSVPDKASGLVRLVKEICSDGRLFKIDSFTLCKLLSNREAEFCEIFKYLDLNAKDLIYFFTTALSTNSQKAIEVIIKGSKIKSRQTLDKLIKIAVDHEAHEATAMLLEKQKDFESKLKTTKKTSLKL